MRKRCLLNFALVCIIHHFGVFSAEHGETELANGFPGSADELLFVKYMSSDVGSTATPTRGVMISRGCPEDHDLPCVPKCCDVFHSYDSGKDCTASHDDFLPEFVDCPNTTQYFKEIPLEQRYEYFIGDPCAKQKYILDVVEYPEDEHYLYSNGTLWYGNRLLAMRDFCVESVNGTPRVFVCFETSSRAEYKYVLYPVGLVISIPLLLFTGAVYIGIERFRDVQGKCLTCHVTCLAVAYFFLSLVQLASQELNSDFCTAAAFIIQFFFVACFFWLNVLCYDTWRNIHMDYSLSSPNKAERSEKLVFIYYSLYAWYMPSILTIVSLIMDLEPTIPESYLKPRFGIQSCWFESDDAALPYFYGPVGVLIAANIVFFVLSARKIYSEQKNYAGYLKNKLYTDSGSVKIPSKYKVYVRSLKRCISLFCVMGINWAAEVVSWIIGGSDLIWLITDIFNTLQGLIIFYIYIIRPRCVRQEVWRRLQQFFACRSCFGENARHNNRDLYFTTESGGVKMGYYCPKEQNIPFIDTSVVNLTEL